MAQGEREPGAAAGLCVYGTGWAFTWRTGGGLF